MATNAVEYLEAILRNIDWPMWIFINCTWSFWFFIYYQSPPNSLKTLFRTSLEALHTRLYQNPSCNIAFSSIKTVGMMIVLPTAWKTINASSVRGSILCPSLPSLPLKLGFTSLTSRQSCPTSQYMNTISKSPYYLVPGGMLSNILIDNVPELCTLDNGNTPLSYMTTVQFARTYNFTSNAIQALEELKCLNVSIVQYAHWEN
ncbi:hypothetical protein THRCLA_09083 [Thraustotheca clavata]|uniref:Uncharacterized protein n=1 Tax=Thraustotheca clavata TaxID=74557 RepID=A0A1V9YZT9_9STRA|nr:hypothetical protein THRCLA_09083 [Thraustotheca clavata]